MSPSPETNRLTAEEWRALGFFYEIVEAEKVWRFVGSQAGLLKFSTLLRAYGSNPKNSEISEHEHFGPYWYLKIVTWNEALITANDIRGSLIEMRALADIIETKVASLCPGEAVVVGAEYSPQSDFALRFEVMDTGFDPASADTLLK
jgi:hypothetical protein